MDCKFKPLFVITPGSVSNRDIRRAEKQCGICIIESKEPEGMRFLDPPITHDVDGQSRAALSLCRELFSQDKLSFYRADMMKWFLNTIMKEPPVQKVLPVKK